MRTQTLKNKKEFDFVYKNSFKVRSEICDICILNHKLENTFYAKFKKDKHNLIYGLSVSKKIGNAVKRNFIKRRLRNIVKAIKKHKVFIIIAKKEINKASFMDINNQIYKIIG